MANKIVLQLDEDGLPRDDMLHRRPALSTYAAANGKTKVHAGS
ncbi:hypothetical protein ABFU84_15190 [Xanthomonas translucens pv. undulosa]|nr:hypothetical protein [Xanthomonas translucens]